MSNSQLLTLLPHTNRLSIGVMHGQYGYPPTVTSFIDRNYSYRCKSVSTKISHDAGSARTPNIVLAYGGIYVTFPFKKINL